MRRSLYYGADSRIASWPVGFGGRYPRVLFNNRCCADLDSEVRLGDEEITFEEMAARFAGVHTEINPMAGSLNTISYT